MLFLLLDFEMSLQKIVTNHHNLVFIDENLKNITGEVSYNI